ncbi:MAG: phosphoribosylaminoimidazolesuccinocarboxamide synthase [Deltaproteobacteria bacterium]|nr:phosphoribosylaminoimidazolesuccinocarboxamide synthase [Deltaproteobacteria bacterium]
MGFKAVRETDLTGLKLINRGKVRDIYDLGEYLLIVATDRISAFDVVMSDPIPDKGKVLTRISAFWFDQMAEIVPHHLISIIPSEFPAACRPHEVILRDRTMLVRKARPLPVECVVRGYLAGSGWVDYQKTGAVCCIPLPEELKESDRLETPVFTPATKAERGTHDENIPFDEMERIVGKELARRVRDISIRMYFQACRHAENHGIIVADTKFEFGLINGQLVLIDELFTPDSSRFWPMDGYRPGGPQNSFDKQFLRDYLISINWDRNPPPPSLPPEIIGKTREKYLEALSRLTGEKLEEH